MFFRQRFTRQVGTAFLSGWSNTVHAFMYKSAALHVGTTLSQNPLARYAHVIVCLFSNQCVHGPLLNLKSRIWLPRVILWYFDADFSRVRKTFAYLATGHRLLWIFLLWNEKNKSWIINHNIIRTHNLYNTCSVISYYAVTVNYTFHIKSISSLHYFNIYSCFFNATLKLFYFTYWWIK